LGDPFSAKQEIGSGMIGKGMGSKTLRFIPLPNIPLPISPFLSRTLPSLNPQMHETV